MACIRRLFKYGLACLPLLLCACMQASGSSGSRCLSDCSPRTGIMAAFGQEATLLEAQMRETREIVVNGNRFRTGILAGRPVVLVLSGIGLPNAVMIAQLMADHFNIRQLVFTGIAGGVDRKLKVGDVVVAQSWLLPQEAYYANGNAAPQPCGTPADLSCLGLALAEPGTPYADGIFPRATNVVTTDTKDRVALQDTITGAPIAYGEMRSDYPVDAGLFDIAGRVMALVEPTLEPICVAGHACLRPAIVMGGRGSTGGLFVANSAYRAYLENELGIVTVDMETAGAAHVAYANGIPFIAFRSVSDLAGDDSHPQEVGAFFGSGLAQRNAARVTLGYLQALADGGR